MIEQCEAKRLEEQVPKWFYSNGITHIYRFLGTRMQVKISKQHKMPKRLNSHFPNCRCLGQINLRLHYSSGHEGHFQTSSCRTQTYCINRFLLLEGNSRVRQYSEGRRPARGQLVSPRFLFTPFGIVLGLTKGRCRNRILIQQRSQKAKPETLLVISQWV